MTTKYNSLLFNITLFILFVLLSLSHLLARVNVVTTEHEFFPMVRTDKLGQLFTINCSSHWKSSFAFSFSVITSFSIRIVCRFEQSSIFNDCKVWKEWCFNTKTFNWWDWIFISRSSDFQVLSSIISFILTKWKNIFLDWEMIYFL